MVRARIPREVLEDRLRKFVLTWRDTEVWELAESVGGNLMYQFQAILGTEFGEPELWQIEANNNSFLTNEERRDVYDMLWSYVQTGILRPITGGPMNQSQTAWGELYITPYGREVLSGGSPLPEDTQEFLQSLKTEAPQLDSTAHFYVEQALRAFRARLYAATAVMNARGALAVDY